MNKSIIVAACASLAMLVAFPGCSSSVKITDRSEPYREIDLTKPDFIRVERFAVTPADVRAMSALGQVTGADVDQSERELRVGTALAAAVQRAVVAELEANGITAHADENAPQGTWRTGVIRGYFFNNDRLGFALRDRQYDARTVFNIREVEIGDVLLDVQTRIHSNMMNAEWEREVERDAGRIAREIVDNVVVPAYQRRGWLVRVTR